MSLAEDLLNSLPEDQPAVTSADPAIEPHIVINADKTLTIPEELKRILVQHEHNIETVTFDCPRYWDDHDLSQMSLRIVFQRSDGHGEPHPVENLRIDESNDRMIHFDWTISENTTLVSGNVKITVCAKLTNAEGVSEREWRTIPNQDLFVNEGMDCSGDEIVERNPDVIEHILAELDDLKNAAPANPDSGQNAAVLEPAEDDMPILYFGGPLAQTKDDIIMPFEYRSKTATHKGYMKTKAAGNSSMAFPKKNQNVKFYKDAACEEKLKISFKGWPKTHKYRVNANWIDITHSRNIVTCRLWADTVRSRPDFDQLPELLRTSPNLGTIDGFPILVYADGVYQGRYTLNIPKDAYMANMDDELPEHCILYAENYDSGWFRAYANIDGTDWSDEVHDVVPDSIRTRWNEVIGFVMNSSDDEFRANLHQYFDVTSNIDYLCVGLASCDYDGFGKNQQYLTYDGQLWYANYYDKDSTWLLMYTGQGFLSADYLNFLREDGNLLYGRLSNIFIQEIQARWPVLRRGPLSFENIVTRFEEFIRICPPHIVAEDYAETTGGGAFTEIPSKATNNIQQIRAAVKARLAFCDEFIANLEPFVPVPCTGITLDKTALTFDTLTTQTLTATIMPEGCTEAVVWESDNEEVATVKNGVVTPVGNGSATITVRCGEQSATCAITVSGVMGNIMSGVTWSLGSIQDGGGIAASTNTVVTSPFDISDYAGQSVIVAYSDYTTYHQRVAFYDNDGAYVGGIDMEQALSNKDEFRTVHKDAATMRIMMTKKDGATVRLQTASETEDIGFAALEKIPGNLNTSTGEIGAQKYNDVVCYVPVVPGERYIVKKAFGSGATYDADKRFVADAVVRNVGCSLFECPEGVAYLAVNGNNAAMTVERIAAKTTIGSSTLSGL